MPWALWPRPSNYRPGDKSDMSRIRTGAARRVGVAVLSGALVGGSALKAAAQTHEDSLLAAIEWLDGKADTHIGSVARFTIPSRCRFTGPTGARSFMEATHNPRVGQEEGVLLCPAFNSGTEQWFVVFSYDPCGYVHDDEGKSLDPDRILESIRRDTEESNTERRSRGWSALSIAGWARPPFYDPVSHNLTWSTQARSDSRVVVNHSVRLLGRGGVLSADLVISPSQLAASMSEFDTVIVGTSFLHGHTYSEWRSGEKTAPYGLAVLVGGGGSATAAKPGLFGKLWKFLAAGFTAAWELITAAVVEVSSWIQSLPIPNPFPEL